MSLAKIAKIAKKTRSLNFLDPDSETKILNSGLGDLGERYFFFPFLQLSICTPNEFSAIDTSVYWPTANTRSITWCVS